MCESLRGAAGSRRILLLLLPLPACAPAPPAYLDAAMYEDPMCLPTSTPAPGCMAPMPGPHFVHPGFQSAQLDHLREKFPSVLLDLHGSRTVAEQADDWFISTNGVRHHLALKQQQINHDEASFALEVETAWLDDRIALLDQDDECKKWCAEEVRDPGTIDFITVEAWHKTSSPDGGDGQLIATFSFQTLDRRGMTTSHSGDGSCSHACEPCPYSSSYYSNCNCLLCNTYCALYNSFGQYMGTFKTGTCC